MVVCPATETDEFIKHPKPNVDVLDICAEL
jgi:hypothetical protein